MEIGIGREDWRRIGEGQEKGRDQNMRMIGKWRKVVKRVKITKRRLENMRMIRKGADIGEGRTRI